MKVALGDVLPFDVRRKKINERFLRRRTQLKEAKVKIGP